MEDECMVEAIRREKEIGLDVLTDGELRRRNYQAGCVPRENYDHAFDQQHWDNCLVELDSGLVFRQISIIDSRLQELT